MNSIEKALYPIRVAGLLDSNLNFLSGKSNSIHQDEIFNGSKKFEFRRSIFKNPQVKKVIVYASSPVQKVIGEFEIDRIINLELNALWQKTSRYSGISEDYFYAYFGDKELGYAIKIKSVKRYKRPLCIKADFNQAPPQSFVYIASAWHNAQNTA